jgi:nickel transport protein
VKVFSLALASLLTASVCFAHQIVASKKDNSYEAMYWNHEAFEPYAKEQLKGVKAFGVNGKSISAGIDYSGAVPKILTDGDVGMMSFSFDAGHWVKGSKGFEHVSANQVKGVVFGTLKSHKFSKTLFSWNEAFSKPVGLYMEMVPLVNPLALKVGDTFPVLVLKEGVPLANAGFESSDEEEPSYKTDAYGIAQIPVKKKGLFIVAAKYYAQQYADPSVDAVTVQSSLSFTVK